MMFIVDENGNEIHTDEDGNKITYNSEGYITNVETDSASYSIKSDEDGTETIIVNGKTTIQAHLISLIIKRKG